MRWKALFHDLKAVLVKHFRPEHDQLPIEARLIKMIAACQKERSELGELVRMQNDSTVFEEFEALRCGALAGQARKHPEDVMFR